ncbi:MAG: ATP-dependent zinc protease [Planctomycetales bacterium]|nr:ATP-dependent zinc protease [Planctomycetales bacterium]
MKDSRTKPIIGWREWVSLPDLGIKFIKAKIDTGARSSSLHAFDLELYEQGDQQWARFKVNPVQRNEHWEIVSTAPVIDMRSIRSSSGQAEIRPVVKTNVVLMGQTFEIELTLTDRNQMGFRMLLGREAFRRRFLIDPGKSYHSGVPKKRKRHP